MYVKNIIVIESAQKVRTTIFMAFDFSAISIAVNSFVKEN